ncbi:phosphorylated adapter RNA export protein isoform X3 [Pteronotus mesoamericanus]|uniref:phosphorylated adapter RNA export protein isoform X3 n=1 Tax=Pteronotus mesoamericanus TaxID=1884717 RepID=UPI0023EC1017|nr:phosphorylated adapter RNA export protein isoform X3 [Pteronotus parnellii mesoamericanus]
MAQETGDMEDGQLSDSDSDMTVAPSDRPLQVPKALGGDSAARPFQGTAATCAPVSHYRTVKGVDSSEESCSDSDDDSSLWKRKRQKCFNPPPKPEPFLFGQSSQKPPFAGGKKINNIWGAVLQEQSQDAVATELGILEMEGTIDKSRQSETYNYLLAKKLKRESQHTTELDKELDEYMQGGKKTDSKEEENGQGHLKRKRPVKDRLGDRLEMNYKGRYEITEDDSQEKVADEITFRLQEPKKDLIARVVSIIGNKKAIELLMETAEVEQNGGLFIMNGSRRRTPGGVFLNLLKNTPSISEEQIKSQEQDFFYGNFS